MQSRVARRGSVFWTRLNKKFAGPVIYDYLCKKFNNR